MKVHIVSELIAGDVAALIDVSCWKESWRKSWNGPEIAKTYDDDLRAHGRRRCCEDHGRRASI